MVGFEILAVLLTVGAYLISLHIFKMSVSDAVAAFAVLAAFALAEELNLKFWWLLGSLAVEATVIAAAIALTPWAALGALALLLFLLAPAEKQATQSAV